jgi:hypothetical protein
MGSIRVAAALIVLGLSLVLVSFLLPIVAPALVEGKWTPEQAKEHAQWSAELHRLAHQRAHAQGTSAEHQDEKPLATEQEFQTAAAKYKEGDTQLRDAQDRPARIKFWIGCCGGALLLSGLVVYYNYQRKTS